MNENDPQPDVTDQPAPDRPPGANMATNSPAPGRAALFEPGRYTALPDVLLRRTDLAASAKLVWMALASHLGPTGMNVWPSITRLAGLTGLNRKTVIQAIAGLEAAELLLVARARGQPSRYRLLQPEAGLFAATSRKRRPVSKSDQSEKRTSIKNGPVSKTDQSEKRTGVKNGPECTVLNTNTKTPLPPAKSAGGEEGVGALLEPAQEAKPKPAPPRSCEAPAFAYSEEFLEVWRAYPQPRRSGKGRAWRAWSSARGRPAVAVLVAAVAALAKTPQWRKENCRFVPLLATWLNDRGWEDESIRPAAAAAPVAPKPADARTRFEGLPSMEREPWLVQAKAANPRVPAAVVRTAAAAAWASAAQAAANAENQKPKAEDRRPETAGAALARASVIGHRSPVPVQEATA